MKFGVNCHRDENCRVGAIVKVFSVTLAVTVRWVNLKIIYLLKSTQYVIFYLIFKWWNTYTKSNFNEPENSFLNSVSAFHHHHSLLLFHLCFVSSILLSFQIRELFFHLNSFLWSRLESDSQKRKVLLLTLNKQRQAQFE